jgi:hypothetical protein
VTDSSSDRLDVLEELISSISLAVDSLPPSGRAVALEMAISWHQWEQTRTEDSIARPSPIDPMAAVFNTANRFHTWLTQDNA